MFMAFLDNPTIILAHIRQSHVTSDDTGMCEMVLIDHDVDLDKFHPSSAFGDHGAEPQGSNGDTQGYVYSQSVDITSSWDFGIRRRSNTAEELSSLFEKKNFRVKSPCSGKQSILSVRLEQCPLQLNNPFNEYSKFDGKSCGAEQPRAAGTGSPSSGVCGQDHNIPNTLGLTWPWVSAQGHVGTTATKKIDVYLPLHTSQDKLQPMTVVTIANAKVHDLIGLICWQYTSEGREPKLNTLALVEKYSSPGLAAKQSLFVRMDLL
ncbi:hypothetical protein IHE44_0007307 [Lamprotornis superbus]|uniref:Target of rapamycin complex 2 subunit MAPKAP1 n=1 Tax=Lamprotornis superbus TaxID=245042 RepID=A0A835NWA4_9PASS|nr:hypothetical protein IHE44_0007307 [Lamprotornis superbus]